MIISVLQVGKLTATTRLQSRRFSHYMSFGTLVLSTIALWLAIYALHRIFNSSHDHFNLPQPAAATSSAFARTRAWEPSTRITLHNLYLRIETKAFNKLHARWITRFGDADKSSGTSGKRMLTLFYEAGSVFATLGMIGALCAVIWTAWNLLAALSASFAFDGPPMKSGSTKRDLEVTELAIQVRTAGQLLKPIVSPMSHAFNQDQTCI